MDIKTAKKSVNENIKGYKTQRSNEVLEITPFNELNSMYYTHAPQLGIVLGIDSNASLVIGGCFLGALIIYEATLNRHYLTNDIKTLHAVKALLQEGRNPFEKHETDDVAKVLKEKKLIR